MVVLRMTVVRLRHYKVNFRMILKTIQNHLIYNNLARELFQTMSGHTLIYLQILKGRVRKKLEITVKVVQGDVLVRPS